MANGCRMMRAHGHDPRQTDGASSQSYQPLYQPGVHPGDTDTRDTAPAQQGPERRF